MAPDSLMRSIQHRVGLVRVRCACQACGVHHIAKLGLVLGGQCDNCASYDLVAVCEEPPSRERQAIESFSIEEVDRDKIALYGERC